ncbi:MAG: Protein containing NUDIX hydrolase, core-like protein [Parcubacteria group bacterium GW2011_GWC2_38_7]|nr:MAG: Protein containing NUDIX hydrolase, core-like protein [Parcubacteria group bacterium GW2011_GWC2_38_7]
MTISTNNLNKPQTFWVCNLIYEIKVKNLNFTPSDECVQLKFFTKEEALKEKLYNNVSEFIKLFDPDNHK